MTDMRILFIVVPVGLCTLVSCYIYLALSRKYYTSFVNFFLVSLGALFAIFFYWAIWLGGLTGENLSVLNLMGSIGEIIGHSKSGKTVIIDGKAVGMAATDGEFAWYICLVVIVGPAVFASIFNTILLRFFGKKKVKEEARVAFVDENSEI